MAMARIASEKLARKIRMKQLGLFFILAMCLGIVVLLEEAGAQTRTTTVFIVRHAERADTPGDSPLSEEGEKRAETLARMLRVSGVSAVFSTDTTRTRETVNNYADMKELAITLYDSVEEVASRIKSDHVGQAVLVAGHSNTISPIAEALGVSPVPDTGEEYDNLYVVTISSEGTATLTHLKFQIQNN
jgi:2,3-bisphosphoglycerate-dependent phosphoglycerate mutase